MKTIAAIPLVPVMLGLILAGCEDPVDFFQVNADSADSITAYSAILKGNWEAESKETFKVTEVGFFYGKDDPPYPEGTRAEAPFPKNSDGLDREAEFSLKISNLQPFTTYFYQPYIKVDGQLIPGTSSRFTTLEPEPDKGTFTDDRNGKTYGWIRIGKQVWMSENLAWIPAIYGPDEGSSTEVRYYIYGDDGSNQGQTPDTYGKFGVLYNYAAATSACPPGWELPSDAQWSTLTSYIAYPEGSKMKEIGSAYWSDKNTDATNSSGFSVRGGGQRYYLGGFMRLGTHAYFWTSTDNDATTAWDRSFQDTQNRAIRGNSNRASGYSVRCIRK
jgi:uncharacterized protein (TIGR02145 family)